MNKYNSVACVGMDVHHRFSKVAFRDSDGKLIGRERWEHQDRQKLKAKLLRLPRQLPVIMESSFGWPWLSDMLEDAELKPKLSNCRKVDKMREARGYFKTNDKDAEILSLLSFETTDWWEVWRAPKDVRDQREWMRYRASLVANQTRTKQRIHAIFHRHGIFHEFSDLFGAKGRAFLIELCKGDDERLSGGALKAFQGYISSLDRTRKELADIARRLKRELKHSPTTVRLMSIPGIGLILSHVIAAEIGRIDRFASHGKLASYCCLAPRSSDSGEDDPNEKPKGRHIGSCGNLTLKWAFIEAAHGAVTHGGRFREIFDRATDGGRTNRGRGYIKVARELVKIVTAVWRHETNYVEQPPRRPGSSKKRQLTKQQRGKRRNCKMINVKTTQPRYRQHVTNSPKTSGFGELVRERASSTTL